MKETYYNGRLTVNKEIGQAMKLKMFGLHERIEAALEETPEIEFDFWQGGCLLTETELDQVYRAIQGQI